MYICEYCGREFERKEQIKGHYGKCEVKYNILTSILTPTKLNELMFEKMMSANYIGKKWMKEQTGHEYGASAIISLAKKYGFQTRSLKESNHNPERQKLCKETLSKKYGKNVTNISQIESVKLKKESTFIKHFGIRNIFCNSKYIMKCFEDKYGVTCNTYRKEAVIKYSNGVRSKIHRVIEEFLDNHDIIYESEPVNLCVGFNKDFNKEYHPRPDIVIPSLNIVFEIQGDKWHANPHIYKKTDIITGLWCGDMLAMDVWERDLIRKNHIESFGYKVYYIWEYDIKHNLPEVKQFILNIVQNENCKDKSNS